MDRVKGQLQLADDSDGHALLLVFFDLNGASVDGRWRGCPPARDQRRRTARIDDGLAGCCLPGGGASTENRYQLVVMPSGATRLVLLFSPEGGGRGQRRRRSRNRPA
jgi:hypothetical protein